MRILIVEDEIKIRNGMTRLISGYAEHEVVGKAKNGREGLEMICRLKPDLVFTDIRMPEMDGLTMLHDMKERGLKCHCVILTGYAEFDYAKKAFAYEADDYLLKPIDAGEVEKILARISDKVRNEAMQFSGTPEGYFKALIDGLLDPSEETIRKAEVVLGFGQSEITCLLGGYFADPEGEEKRGRFEELARAVKGISCRTNDGRIHYTLFHTEKPEVSLQKINTLLRLEQDETDWVYVLKRINHIADIPQCAESIQEGFSFSLAIGNRKVIFLDEVKPEGWKEYSYTLETETRIHQLLCDGEQGELAAYEEELYRSIWGKGYAPSSVRHFFVRAANDILHLANTAFPEKSRQLIQLDAVTKTMTAVTLRELLSILDLQFRVLLKREEIRQDIGNYTVLRAISYVREHYADRISQEEVAERLQISPEYLSTLFNREMQVNFATFVNQFRISHAKRLLKSSDRKIYEIAEQVGFSDPKYFNRVFKELEGISPKEFRDK